MNIRHVVEAANIDSMGYVLDPFKIRHGVVRAKKLWSLAGLIDPKTHLNLDFIDHKVTDCIIAASFEKDSNVEIERDGFVFAAVKSESYKHIGFVDIDKRRIEWMERCKLL